MERTILFGSKMDGLLPSTYNIDDSTSIFADIISISSSINPSLDIHKKHLSIQLPRVQPHLFILRPDTLFYCSENDLGF